MLENGLHIPSGWNYPLSHCNTQHVTLIFSSRPLCSRQWRMYGTDTHFSPVHTASKPYATYKAQNTGCKYIQLVCASRRRHNTSRKDREGVMTEAGSFKLTICFAFAELRSEKSKRKLFRNVTVGAYDGTDGPR